MERAALLCRGDLIVPEHLPARIRPGATAGSRGESMDAQRLEEIESQAVIQALHKHNFNRTATAKTLGISRRALIYKLQRLREQGQNVDPA
jgi:DNA-binding NtrC family response regulator